MVKSMVQSQTHRVLSLVFFPLIISMTLGKFVKLSVPYFFFFGRLFAISRAASAAYGGSQARGLIGAIAAGLHQSHNHEGSEPCLQPTSQLVATPDS